MNGDYRAWPKPRGYAEGTVMTPEQVMRWVNSMPEEEQLAFFEDVADRMARSTRCWEMDHEGQLESAMGVIGRQAEEISRLREAARAR